MFYLLAESFDDDPFAILAWRGREREDLLANLAAARSEGPPAADRAEHTDPLVDCLDTFLPGAAISGCRARRRRQRRRCSTSCPMSG